MKLFTPENLPINRESNFIICDYTNLVEQDDPVEPKRSNMQPTREDIEKARAEGYVLGADWKTQQHSKLSKIVAV